MITKVGATEKERVLLGVKSSCSEGKSPSSEIPQTTWFEGSFGLSCCLATLRTEHGPFTGRKKNPAEQDGRRKRKEEVQESGASSSSKPEAPPPVIDPESLLDTRMLEAAAKRRRVKSFQELKELNKKSETKESDYLEELLQEPS